MAGSVVKNEGRILTNELEIGMAVVSSVRNIRERTGYGSILLDIKDGLVVGYSETVREHLN